MKTRILNLMWQRIGYASLTLRHASTRTEYMLDAHLNRADYLQHSDPDFFYRYLQKYGWEF